MEWRKNRKESDEGMMEREGGVQVKRREGRKERKEIIQIKIKK